jgi:hypothetical protein
MSRSHSGWWLPAAMAAMISIAGSAAPAAAAKRNPIPKDAPTFREAARLIESGRNYDSAADGLQGLIAEHPGNTKYHLALGCAYADRAASLAHALTWRQMLAEMTAQYPKDLADWKAAQSNPKAEGYGNLMPAAPAQRVFTTKDDGKPLTASDEQIVKSINRLNAGAQQEWAQAIRLSRTRTARAEAEYTMGWGRRLLHRAERAFGGDPIIKGLSLPKDSSQEEFAAAVKDDPQRADYWQSLGDTLSAIDERALLRSIGIVSKAPAGDGTEKAEAYRKSLALQPHNAGVWLQLADLYFHDDPKTAAGLLRSAAREAPDSAWVHYEAAYALLNMTVYEKIYNHDLKHDPSWVAQIGQDSTPQMRKIAEEALREIERGNACRDASEPQYEPPVPASLKAGWDYGRTMENLTAFPNYARLRSAARAISGYAIISEYRKESDQAMRASIDTVKMGERLAGTWPIRESAIGSQEILRTLVGVAIIDIGYSAQRYISRQTGDPQLIARTDSARAQFDQRVNDYKAAMKPHIGEPSLIDSY